MFRYANRIVAAMSLGVAVLQGAEYSGSLVTARLGVAPRREVDGVPGPVTAELSFAPPPPDPAGRKMGEGSGRRDRAGPSRVSSGAGDYKGGAGVPICRRALDSRSKGSSVCLASVSWRPGHALARKSEVTSPEGLAALCERAR